MRKGDTVSGAIVAAFGLIFLIATISNSKLTIAPATSDGVPGAGFFPFVMSSVLIILGIVLMLIGLRQKTGTKYIILTPEIKQNLKILMFSVIGLIVFLAFWRLTQWFYPGILLLSLYLNKIFERNWKFTFIYSAVFTVFIYLVFDMVFSVQFG